MADEKQQPIESAELTADDFAADDAAEQQEQQPGAQAQDQDGERDGREEVQQQGQQPNADENPPPEFWSADSKALWRKLDGQPELQAALREMNARERRAVSAKFEEAAGRQKEAEAAKAKHDADMSHVARWFEQYGPQIVQTVQSRWAGVDWNKLAAENPAQWAAARQQYESEMAVASNAARQHQTIREGQARKASEELQAAKVAEHAKLAAELPAEFGDGKAQATYDTLSKFLLDSGISAERLAGVYEAPIVKIVLDAYRYRQLQAKMKAGATQPANGQQNATTTPRRIQPGPASNGGGNRQSDAERQAIEALKSGRRLTAEEAALAFR